MLHWGLLVCGNVRWALVTAALMAVSSAVVAVPTDRAISGEEASAPLPGFRFTPPNPPNAGILFVDHSGTNRSGHLGHALVEYADGKILAFYPNCSDDHGGHSAVGWMEFKRSEDGGATWSGPHVLPFSKQLFERGEGRSAMAEKAVRTDQGQIVLFYLVCDISETPLWRPYGVPLYTTSADGGRTWSEPEPVCEKRGRVYDGIYHDGEILALHFANDATRNWTGTEDEHVYELHVSTDNGKTFSQRSQLPFVTRHRGYGSMGILKSGELIASIYDAKDERVLDYATSADGGRTWSAVKTSRFSRKIRNPQFIRYADRFFMHGRSGAYGEGSGHMILYASDDGVHWDDGRYLRMQDAGTGAYSNSIVVGSLNPDKPERLLIQASHAYEKSKTNILHWWIDRAQSAPAAAPAPPLWNESCPVPKASEVALLDGVRFHVIKRWEPDADGYKWLHGVALAWHKGRLYASFGHNKDSENTASEEARWRASDDGGVTWSPVRTLDSGEGNLGVSHGVFLSSGGRLWAFHGAFYDAFQRTHTRAYVLDEATASWQPRGVVVTDGFWPLQQPLKMGDGNWILAGVRVAKGYSDRKGHLPAVAISHGDDLTRWDLVVIPTAGADGVWGESTVVLDGDRGRVVNVARWGAKAKALVAVSKDYGRTWTPARPSNLPMTTSKPYAGTLPGGRHYLIGTTTADGGKRRHPVTIALTEPEQATFSKVVAIRRAVFPQGPGESHPNVALAYPYAVQHDGHLYVGYSNSGGRGGNHNSAELAVIPLSRLAPK